MRQYGIQGHCLYYGPGSGLQNASDIPVTVTNNDIEIKRMVDGGSYQAVVIVSDYMSLQKFRMLGYGGKINLEIQGYGPRETAKEELRKASLPFLRTFER